MSKTSALTAKLIFTPDAEPPNPTQSEVLRESTQKRQAKQEAVEYIQKITAMIINDQESDTSRASEWLPQLEEILRRGDLMKDPEGVAMFERTQGLIDKLIREYAAEAN